MYKSLVQRLRAYGLRAIGYLPRPCGNQHCPLCLLCRSNDFPNSCSARRLMEEFTGEPGFSGVRFECVMIPSLASIRT